MSFRARLLLFFTIIVVIPMIAVALVLFSITADSETGKADAQIAQGLRAAFAIYDADRAGARPALDAIASDPGLAAALTHPKPGAVRSRLTELRGSHPSVAWIAAFDPGRRQIASTGAPDVVALAVAAPSTGGGRPLGYVAISTTPAGAYVRAVARTTGLTVRVARQGRVVASSVREPPGGSPRSGDVTVAGTKYRGRFAQVSEAAGPTIQVGLFERESALNSAITRKWLLIGAILVGFLLLALISSRIVARALQDQIAQFLDAARRLAHGDFSRPVPVEGSDEFAELGREFNAMSDQLASNIDEVSRKRHELEDTIRRVGEAFAAGLDRGGIVNLAVRTAVDACEADTGRALPIDKRRMRSARIGDATDELEAALESAERSAFAVDTDIGADWLASLEAASEDETTEQRKPVRAEVDGYHALAAPLVARLGSGSAIEQVGVISIARKGRPFDDSEYELFTYLTGQAAVSIENVDLHETVRLQAVTDELTGLYNRNHFYETLDSEIERSRRFGTDVGLVMLDIDDFKHVNDTFGHLQGDAVLVEVARVLRDLSRDIDEPARYGGEELSVILPQTDLHGAELAAERMRAAIEDLRIPAVGGGESLAVTASFGVAALPVCAHDRESLVAEADAALYRAKRAGKNRVRRSEPVPAEAES
ncbi:MAG: diguanylate cyclase [Actinobacteria bacterium]|nr:diguanylate cyclase [Actinomycetota bacterium]